MSDFRPSAEIALYAASVVVEAMSPADLAHHSNSKGKAVSAYKARLEMNGLKVLKKKELYTIWDDLKGSPFVRTLPSIRKSDKMDVWRNHLKMCFQLDGARHLRPRGTAAPAAAAMPTVASVPAVASLPGIPVAASLPRMTSQAAQQMASAAAFSPHMFMGNTPPNSYSMRQLPQEMPQQLALQQMQQMFQNEMRRYGAASSSPMAAAAAPNNTANNMMALFAGGTAMAPGPFLPNESSPMAGPGSSRKRKSPGNAANMLEEPLISPGSSDDTEDLIFPDDTENLLFRGMMASQASTLATATAAAAGNPTNVATAANVNNEPTLSPVERRILPDLMRMGFSESDKKECLDAIKRGVEKSGDNGQSLTSEAVMMDIVTQREEAEEARKMDEARRQSETTNQEESERLREQRKQNEENIVLNASFEELRSPSSEENKKLMFPKSWLLRHKECVDLLTLVCDDAKYADAKKALVKILTHEKNAKKWFGARDLPKCYFTFELTDRLLAAHGLGDPQGLQTEMDAIEDDTNRGMSLLELQNKDSVPRIFFNAQEQYKEHYQQDSQAAGENTGDDDDDCIVILDDDEIEQLRAKNAAPEAGLDTADKDPVVLG